MSFFRSLLPITDLPGMEGKSELEILRERILQGLWLVVFAFSTFLVVSNIPNLVLTGQWQTVAYYIIGVIIVGAITFIRQLPYYLRAFLILAIPLAIGVLQLIESGVEGNGKLLIVFFFVLAVALLNFRAALIAFALGVIAISTVGIGMTVGFIPIPDISNVQLSDKPGEWIILGVTSAAIFGVLALAFYNFVLSLNRSLKTQSAVSRSLELERGTLEDRISQRTQDVERRSLQIRTAAEISRSISTLLDPQEVIQTVADLIRDRFNLYYVGVFLVDESSEYAVLKAGTGEAGEKMIGRGHRLAVGGSSMIGWATATRQSRIALDVGTEATRFNNPLLPFTRSELAIPIITRDQVLGAISIQSTQSEAFDEDDIVVMQSIADSLAIALQNARLYQETQETLSEIETLNRAYIQQAWTEARGQHEILSYAYEDATVSASGLRHVEIPLLLRDQPLGTISLDVASTAFTEEEQAFLDSIATQTAQALENSRLLEETQRRAMQERKLNELSALFNRALNVEDILKTAVTELGRLPAVAEVAIALTPPTEDKSKEVDDRSDKEQA